MTFTQLRKYLHHHPGFIRWTNSGIVEYAEVEENGAIRVTNVISKKSYILPKRTDKLHVEIYKESVIALGSLMPKGFGKK